MNPFPEATGREATPEDVGEQETTATATADADTETADDEAEQTAEEGHLCDPESPVPCQFH